jgi:hypothetical protein
VIVDPEGAVAGPASDAMVTGAPVEDPTSSTRSTFDWKLRSRLTHIELDGGSVPIEVPWK